MPDDVFVVPLFAADRLLGLKPLASLLRTEETAITAWFMDGRRIRGMLSFRYGLSRHKAQATRKNGQQLDTEQPVSRDNRILSLVLCCCGLLQD